MLNTAGQIVLASSLNAPLGLALDTSGDLLIANSVGGNVLELPNEGGVFGLLPAFSIGTGFKKPTAIAVDASNNIFVADATLASVVEITAAGVQSNALGNFSALSGLAVDANDDLFLTQTNVPTVTKVAFTSGAYATNSTVALGTGLAGPQGIALDSAGNLYVADAAGGTAYEIQRTLGGLNFGKVNTSFSSAPQSLSLSNSGNQGLTFSSPFYMVTAGNTSDFSITASANNGCATALVAGASCGASVTFSPTATGARTETVVFQSNAVNAATLGAMLTGTGANSAPVTLALAVSPTGALSFGQTITVTATLTPVMTSTATPTGTVQFSVDGNPYGMPVAVSASGTASQNITGLAGGSHVINASYNGDSNFASAAATTPLSLVIVAATTTTTLSATINGSTAVPTGTSVTFTATVNSAFTPTPYPSGSVSFFQAGNTVALGTSPLTNGVATFTTTALPNGQYNVTAVYSGDVDFSPSTSAGFAVYVSPSTYVLSSQPTTLSVATVGSASIGFTLTPISGYTGTVFLACSGLPQNSTCTFNPGAVDFTVTPGAQSVQLTVSTGIAPASFAGLFAIPSFLALAAIFVFARRKQVPRLLTIAVFLIGGAIASASLTGCSNGMNFSSPSGSSNVTVQLTGSPAVAGGPAIQQSFTFSLQVH